MAVSRTVNDTRDVEEFLLSMSQCFDNVEKGLKDEDNSIPLDYLECRLDGHFQVVHAIAVALENENHVHDELKLLIEELLLVMQGLLQEVSTAKVTRRQREVSSRAWVPNTEESTGGRPRYNITKEQIETLRETGMKWKGIALCLGISESTYRRRQELGLHGSFVDISDGELKAVVLEILSQTPYAGESYVWWPESLWYLCSKTSNKGHAAADRSHWKSSTQENCHSEETLQCQGPQSPVAY